MSSEITIRQQITIKDGNVNYSPPQSQKAFDLTAAIAFGPCPGALTVTYAGVDVDLSALSDPAWFDIQNLEADGGAEVSVGIYDPQARAYFPFLKLRPGARVIGEFDEFMPGEYVHGTGTGSASGGGNRLRLKSKSSSSAKVYVGIFER